MLLHSLRSGALATARRAAGAIVLIALLGCRDRGQTFEAVANRLSTIPGVPPEVRVSVSQVVLGSDARMVVTGPYESTLFFAPHARPGDSYSFAYGRHRYALDVLGYEPRGSQQVLARLRVRELR